VTAVARARGTRPKKGAPRHRGASRTWKAVGIGVAILVLAAVVVGLVWTEPAIVVAIKGESSRELVLRLGEDPRFVIGIRDRATDRFRAWVYRVSDAGDMIPESETEGRGAPELSGGRLVFELRPSRTVVLTYGGGQVALSRMAEEGTVEILAERKSMLALAFGR